MRCLVVALGAALGACSSPTSQPTEPKGVPPSIGPARPAEPQLVDSHVHLAYYPVADALAKNRIGGAVDLASPESALGAEYPILVIQSGPMLTRPNGYPLTAWGADGYGIGCDSEDCVSLTIGRLHRKGARAIKIALDQDGLEPRLVRPAIDAAHALGMKVVVHALTNESVKLAGREGADVLAHTPLEPLTEEALESWRVVRERRTSAGAVISASGPERAVISTLAAFGGTPTAIDNLRKLREMGMTILYGTDLGNLRVAGPSSDEIELMKLAGMDTYDIENAMTHTPWRFWGFDVLGARRVQLQDLQ